MNEQEPPLGLMDGRDRGQTVSMTRVRNRPPFVLVLCRMPLFSCAGRRPSTLGVTASGLAPCPSSPNCVSSDAADAAHQIPPLAFTVSAPDAWQSARAAVAALPRTEIVTATSDYLHAECRSALFGFVDDLELQLRPGQAIIAVRSASRLGYSDLGVNRRRVERIRAALAPRLSAPQMNRG